MTSDRSILLKIKTDACAGTEYAVNYLEHVQAVISVNATRRGDLELFLTSPMGTRYVDQFRAGCRTLCPKMVLRFPAEMSQLTKRSVSDR